MDEKHINCPECGCGFIAKYDDGLRICLYCPHIWNQLEKENNPE